MEERIVVTGGRPLNGSVKIPAAKKAKADSGNGQRLYVKAYSLFFYELFKQFVNFQKGS